jgi:hypothetical protein
MTQGDLVEFCADYCIKYELPDCIKYELPEYWLELGFDMRGIR